MVRRHYPVLAPLSGSYSEPKGRFPRVTHPCATRPEGLVRLACVRHAASVRSEPESNSQVDVRPPVPARNSTSLQGRLQGAVPAHHILLWICNETWNDLALPILRGLELLGDRGRRPHVPSSKPTMSKSRRVSLPVLIRVPFDRLRETQTGLGRTPCPVGEAPYMEDISYRQWPFFEKLRSRCQKPDFRAEAIAAGGMAAVRTSPGAVRKEGEPPIGSTPLTWPR